MSETQGKDWKTAIYVRLSKDDGDKAESNSITNQKDLINEYLKSYTDIRVVTTKIDDGYSGVNFERPAFVEMMEEIKKGQVNCVVVKDLSRFGRNFEETGKYLEQIFPFLGVRFISVNDRIDSTNKDSTNDGIILPFKNLINDAYCGDISIKIRSQQAIKRKKGEFIGAFATYGYLKGNHVNADEKISKHALVVDEYASTVVKDIFKWKIEGYSQLRIAEMLNEMGVLPPSDYKKFIGLNYNTTFKNVKNSKWSENAVRRILKNEVYIGTLIQGKTGKPNHKIKKSIKKDKSEWVIIKDNHEPIISKEDFYLVNELNNKDTRVGEAQEKVYLLSGILVCADCGQNMVRKTVPSRGKKYHYYVCVNNKLTKECSSHSINFEEVEYVVEKSIKSEIEKMIEVDSMFGGTNNIPFRNDEVETLNKHVEIKKEELAKYEKYRVNLFEKFIADIITKEDYLEFKEIYEENINNITESIEKLNSNIKDILTNTVSENNLIQKFSQFKNSKMLTREMVVTLVEEILVYNDKSIEIKYKFNQEQRKRIGIEIATLQKSKEVVVNG